MCRVILFLLFGLSVIKGKTQDYRLIKKTSTDFLDSVSKGFAFRISGTVKGHDANYFYFLNDRFVKIDSAIINDGKFELTGVVNKPGFILCQLGGSYYVDQFILENGDMRIFIDAKPYTFRITGGTENEKYNIFSAKAQGLYKQLDSFADSIKLAKQNADVLKFVRYIDSSEIIEKAYLSFVGQQIDSSNVGLYLVRAINNGRVSYSYFKDRLSFFNRLPPDLRNSEVGKRAFRYLMKLNPDTTKTIPKAASFSLANKNGKITTLDSFKGSYLLIDFWASWCIPCLEELPLLKEIYAHHNPSGVRFLSISIDKNKADWLKMEEKFPLKWTSVLGDESMSIKYNISSIPKKILIDPSGNIIAEGVSLEKIYRILSDLE